MHRPAPRSPPRRARCDTDMLEAKFEIVDKYMKNDWGIDLDELRKVVLRRQKELPNLDLDATN